MTLNYWLRVWEENQLVGCARYADWRTRDAAKRRFESQGYRVDTGVSQD